MKREVAVKTGNFRRVCPTMNRAKGFQDSYVFFGYCTACGVNPVKRKHSCRRNLFRLLIRGAGNARQSVPISSGANAETRKTPPPT